MITERFQSLFADPYGAPAMIRRLLAEHALRHRKLYIAAFLMMGVAAACTALSAYLLGDVVNQAYVHKNFRALVIVGIAAFGLFALKGAATYGQQVIMMRIGNRIDCGCSSHAAPLRAWPPPTTPQSRAPSSPARPAGRAAPPAGPACAAAHAGPSGR